MRYQENWLVLLWWSFYWRMFKGRYYDWLRKIGLCPKPKMTSEMHSTHWYEKEMHENTDQIMQNFVTENQVNNEDLILCFYTFLNIELSSLKRLQHCNDIIIRSHLTQRYYELCIILKSIVIGILTPRPRAMLERRTQGLDLMYCHFYSERIVFFIQQISW